jgi:hypothetical protein
VNSDFPVYVPSLRPLELETLVDELSGVAGVLESSDAMVSIGVEVLADCTLLVFDACIESFGLALATRPKAPIIATAKITTMLFFIQITVYQPLSEIQLTYL